MGRRRQAVGVDIGHDQIRLVVLEKDNGDVRLKKSASCPVPEGAIKNGSVEDPEKLARAIRSLRLGNRIGRTNRAAVSLLASPMVLQTMEVPKPLPGNIGQFVHREVRRCVALTGKEISLDFCRLGLGKEAGDQLFVVAADQQKAALLGEAYNKAGLNVDAIEPPLLSYARAFYAKKIAGKFDCNVAIVILQDGASTFSVFRKQTLDFVSMKDIPPERANADELCKWLGEQISEIIRFYNFEVADSSDKWEITVVADCVQSPDETEQSLRAEIAGASIQVKTVEDTFEETPFGESAGSSKPSPVAIGLAMKLLGEDDVGLAINVVPPESAQIRSAKKEILIAANFVAALVLVMILTAGGFGLMTDWVEQRIYQSKQDGGAQSIHGLLREEEALDRRIKQLSERPDLLKSIFASHSAVDWPALLEDIRGRTPETLRITRLYTKKGSGVYLEGLALSYETVHLFVNLLNKSGHIESASLAHTKKDYEAGDLIRYAINCSLASEEKGS